MGIEGYSLDAAKAYEETVTQIRRAAVKKTQAKTWEEGRVEPSWRANMAEWQHLRYTTTPTALGEKLQLRGPDEYLGRTRNTDISKGEQTALEIIMSDSGAGALNHQYGDPMDPYYKLPNGDLDTAKLERDNFVVRVEEAYWAARGDVPIDFFIDNVQDLELLGPAYADTVRLLYNMQTLQTYENARITNDRTRAIAGADAIVAYQGVTQDRANEILLGLKDIGSIISDELAVLTTASRGGHGPTRLREKVAQMQWERLPESDPMRQLPPGTLDPKLSQQGLQEMYLEMRAEDLAAERGIKDVGQLLQETGITPKPNFTAGLGMAFNNVVSGTVGALNAIPGLENTWLADLKPTIYETARYIPGTTDPQRDREIAEKTLRDQLGQPMTDQERLVLSAGISGDVFDYLLENSPLDLSALLTSAGGDEAVAKMFFIDDMANREEIQADMQREKDKAITVQLKKLEESDFGAGTALLDTLSIWGDATEYVATGGATALKYWLADGRADDIFSQQFLQDIQDYETPAGVFGLEGTLIGLGINILGMAIVDPFTYILAPSLAKGASLGPSSLDDVARVISNPMNESAVNHLIKIGQSVNYDNLAWLAATEDFAVVGLDSMLLQAMGGWKNGIRNGSRLWHPDMFKVSTDVTDDILRDIPILGTVDPADLEKAVGRVRGGSTPGPVEATINPVTGAVGVTKNADMLLALRAEGIDAIPMTFKIDTAFALVDGPVDLLAAREALAPAGTMSVDDLYQMREVDVLKSVKAELGKPNVTGRQRVDKLKESLLKDGYEPVPGETAVTVEIHPTTGEIVLTDGNHRVTAMKELDMNIPIEVDLKLMSEESIAWNATKFDDVGEGVTLFDRQYRTDLLAKQADSSAAYPEWASGVDITGGTLVDDTLHLNPESVLGKSRFGAEDIQANLLAVEEAAVKMGVRPFAGQQTVLATRAGAAMKALYRKSPTAAKIAKFLTPINTNISFQHSGTMAKSNILQFGTRLWASADDMLSWTGHHARIEQFYGRQAVAELRANTLRAEAKTIYTQREELLSILGGSLDTDLEVVGRGGMTARKALLDEMTRIDDEIARIRIAQGKIAGEVNNFTELNTVMQDMVDDFNRQHIATHKSYAGTELVDGMVPWDLVAVGRRDFLKDINNVAQYSVANKVSLQQAANEALDYIPKEMNKAIKLMESNGVDANTLLNETMHMLQSPGSWNAPISPIEMIAAAAGGRTAVRGTIEAYAGSRIAQQAHAAHTMWMLDKVLTPRTGLVVSLDEWMRIFHSGGTKTLFQFAEDKAMKLAARATFARSNAASFNRLPVRWQERIVALQETPTYFKQLERSFNEINGYGYNVIKYEKGVMQGHKEYYRAASRTASQIENDKVFQAYMKGPEYFKGEWWDTATEADKLRTLDFADPALEGRRLGITAEEAYQTYDSIFNDWVLGGIKAKNRAEARKIWQAAVARAAEKGSTASGPSEMPEWVLRGFQQVTGNKNNVQGPVNKTLAGASNVLFDNPMEYRRGFLAELVRKTEYARLDKLYASQGKRVVSEAEIASQVRLHYPDISDSVISLQMDNLAADLFKNQGVISQRMVDEIVERQVIAEMEHTLYSFQMSSRAGRASKGLFPFGKPWADMWAHWGRNVVARPALRGWVNDTNLFGISKVANKAVDSLPFNPRTAAFMSRLSTTDFNLDRIDEDPLVGGAAQAVGLSAMNLSPAIFLPTGGEQPFGTVLPGFGFVPSFLAQMYFNAKAPDPLEEPLEYKRMLEQYSTFFPNIGYSQPGSLAEQAAALLLGGGVTSRTLKIGQGLAAASPWSVPVIDALTSDWNAAKVANNEIRVMFQDADFMRELQELQSLPGGLTDLAMTALLDERLGEKFKEARQVAGQQQLKEAALEGIIPVRAKFATQGDALDSVWMDTTEWMGLETPVYYDTSTQEGIHDAAEWARTQFFALPTRERDALVTEHPGLAVNLVSGWTWTDRAYQMGLPETGLPYRTTGSTQGLAKHAAMQQQALIRPLTPRELATVVIGTQATARANTAHALYETAMTAVNDARWDWLVPEEDRAYLQGIADWLVETGELPYTTAREVWENESKVAKVQAALFPETLVDEDGEKVPGWTFYGESSWGEEYPSSPEGMRDDLEDIALRDIDMTAVTDEMRGMAEALGIQLEEGQSFLDFYTAISSEVQQGTMDNPLFAWAGAAYTAWTQPRSAGLLATTSLMSKLINGANADPETAYNHSKTMVYINEAQQRKYRGDDSWLTMRTEAVDLWGRMMQDDVFKNQDMPQRWNEAWGRSLGFFDWVPDEPLPLDANTAERVFVREVVDGDTIRVTQGGGIMGGNTFYSVRLLGVNTAELGTEEGEAARKELNKKIMDAINEGLTITVVRDPDRYGNVDMYGRQFGWLYIGDEAVYMPETMLPGRDD